MGTSSWYNNDGKKTHIAIPVIEGTSITISCSGPSGKSGHYAFLTKHNPPYSNGNTIPFVSGTSRVLIDSGKTVTLKVPSTAKYLALTIVDGDNNN